MKIPKPVHAWAVLTLSMVSASAIVGPFKTVEIFTVGGAVYGFLLGTRKEWRQAGLEIWRQLPLALRNYIVRALP